MAIKLVSIERKIDGILSPKQLHAIGNACLVTCLRSVCLLNSLIQ
jgi:hypothetical protein